MKKRNLGEDLGLGKLDDTKIGTLNTDLKAIRKQTYNILSAGSERKIVMKQKYRVAALAAAVLTLTITSVFASSTVRSKLGDLISYFKSEKAVELASPEQLEKLSYSVGAADEKNGYRLTLDNIAADENYLNVFYTLYSEKGSYSNAMHDPDITITCLINGTPAELSGNNNKASFYVADKHTVKFAHKYNVSCQDLGETFTLELLGDPGIEITRKLYDEKPLSESEQQQCLHIATEVKKSAAEGKNFDLLLWNNGMKLQKFVYSPFGSQLVFQLRNIDDMTYFAAFDDQKNSLDVVNTGLRLDAGGINSFEILKVTPKTKNLHLVPIDLTCENLTPIRKSAEAFPIEFDASDYGKIVVTGIEYKENEFEILYKKDGFTFFDPSFDVYDKNGSLIPVSVYEVNVNYDNNSYVMHCKGKAAPGQIQSIECLKSDVKLDFDREITINIR